MSQKEKTPLDVAADLLVFAPVGLAIELSKHLPEFAKQGREQLNGPIQAAKFVGTMAAMQGRQQFGEKFRKATEPYFGSEPAAPAPTATAPREKVDLPVANYETLSASQIVAHLAGLSRDELQRVLEYETANRARKTIIARIEQLLN